VHDVAGLDVTPLTRWIFFARDVVDVTAHFESDFNLRRGLDTRRVTHVT
jgi:hypothetical protein